jgi:hypothetical protein
MVRNLESREAGRSEPAAMIPDEEEALMNKNRIHDYNRSLTMKKRAKRWATGIIIPLAVFLFSSTNCKNSTEPDEVLAVDVYAINRTGGTIDVFMDGIFRLTLEDDTNETIPAVTPGTHLFEARLSGTDIILYSASLELGEDVEYYLWIEGPATIEVTNEYGEILSIYMDFHYIGDIGLNITQSIRRVKLGTRELEAKKKTDGTVVATFTVEVTDGTDYSWTITQ